MVNERRRDLPSMDTFVVAEKEHHLRADIELDTDHVAVGDLDIAGVVVGGTCVHATRKNMHRQHNRQR